jgi:hypothetical protein
VTAVSGLSARGSGDFQTIVSACDSILRRQPQSRRDAPEHDRTAKNPRGNDVVLL